MSAIWITTNLSAQLRPTDSVKVSVKALRNLLIDAQQKPILEDEIENLNRRIVLKDKLLSATSRRDSLLIALYKADIVTLADQKNIAVSYSQNLEKQLKRAKRGQRWTAIAGIVTTVSGILFIK